MPEILENAEAEPDATLMRNLDRACSGASGTSCRAADRFLAERRGRTASPLRTQPASAHSGRSPASAPWSQPQSSLPSATEQPSIRVVSSRHGLDIVPRQHSTGGKARALRHQQTRQPLPEKAARSMALDLPSCIDQARRRVAIRRHGLMVWRSERPSRTWSITAAWPTSSLVWPGRCSQAATTTARQRFRWLPEQARKRRVRLGSAESALPLYRTTTTGL